MTLEEINDFVLERIADLESDILRLISASLPNKQQHEAVYWMASASIDRHRDRIKQALNDNLDGVQRKEVIFPLE